MVGRIKEGEPVNTEYRQHLLQAEGLIFNRDDPFTMPDGRVIKAISAVKSHFTCSFRELYYNAFGGTPGGSSVREAYFLTLELIARRNRENPDSKIEAFAVRYGRGFYYVLPREELGRAVDFLRQNEGVLKPYLPLFRLSAQEQSQVRRGRVETEGKVIRRLLRLGMRTTTNMGVPEPEAVNIIMPVIGHPSVWQLLLESPLPVSANSDFQRVFNTSVYRGVLNYFRDRKRAQELRRPLRLLDRSSLKEFFEENPPGSALAERLLRLLPAKYRVAFVTRYLENKQGKELHEALGNTKPHTILERGNFARRKLEEIVFRPVEDWPKMKAVVAVEHLLAVNRDFVERFLAKLPPQLQTRYEELIELKCRQALANRQVAERMGMSEGAVKSIYHRFTRKLLKAAFRENILSSQEVEL